MAFKSIKIFVFVLTVAFVTVLTFPIGYAAGDKAAGKTVYDTICAACHGVDGNAVIPGVPIFTKGERLDKGDADLAKSIKEGIMKPQNPAAPPMPALGLSDDDISNVLAYIRSLKK
ncbi:MAG: c-type cytochrome [Gammaproteobacteria bacterium]|jgi:mono/diheme cytochrome c family protein|nr:c-type cytochrome [Gammaproteobacteria bacterium]